MLSAFAGAVVFDLGKVLLDFDYGTAGRRLAEKSDQSPADIQRHLDQSALLLRYEEGRLSTSEFITEAMVVSGFRGSGEEFGRIFGDIFVGIEPMIGLFESLRRQHPTFLFSNTNELAIRHVSRQFPFYHHFTRHVLSYEHGAMKPHPKLYEVVEQWSGKQGGQLVYIDDRLENIEAGRQRGWLTVCHRSPEETFAELRRLGLTF